jgi:hypothetical protein
MIEANSLRRQFIQDRRFVRSATVSAESFITKIVRQNENDIRTRRRAERGINKGHAADRAQ